MFFDAWLLVEVADPRCSAPEQGRPSYPSACGPGPWHPLGGATPISSLTAGPSQSMTSGANLHDIVTSDASNIQWKSLTDIALYCENLVQSFSLEEETAAEESSDVDGQGEENRSSASPTGLNEKVFHLETVVQQLNEKLQQEQEDKAQLTTEMEQLRQTNQRLHQESQTTVCRLLRVTELLIHNGNSQAPNLHN
ncbi:signal-induced proliferation-associated 1-like protein 3 [Amblyraja radiata]|uniref:signal-induced proliferation-associated 1-like protein 3 n=1 Tax=Amblyraja radiata TaxID=386614 RepID=UPI001402C3E9|nr:signal-induced proliferation-associated 1-like protein 3 [Amblyraja radiata]